MKCPECGLDPIPPTGNCPHCHKDKLVVDQAKRITELEGQRDHWKMEADALCNAVHDGFNRAAHERKGAGQCVSDITWMHRLIAEASVRQNKLEDDWRILSEQNANQVGKLQARVAELEGLVADCDPYAYEVESHPLIQECHRKKYPENYTQQPTD